MVANATVQAAWSGAYNAAVSCITDGNGVCAVRTAALVQNGKPVTLNITDVQYPALPYLPAANKVVLPLAGLTYQNLSATAALTATPLGSAMLVRWSLRDLPGVHKIALYRSASGNPDDAQPLAAVNDIAAQGGEAANEYVHTDAAVAVGETYTYWLVQMEGEEPVGELGQVTVSMGSVPNLRVFVPIINE